jgi:ribonuclease VapC
VDSFALLAYLENEVGASIVEERLQAVLRNESLLYLSAINLGEIVYIIERERSLPTAQLALAQIQQLPIQLLDATLARILAAAHVKAHYPISYADAFVVAAAQELAATILTGDPEFAKVTLPINIEWLPQR